MRMEEQKDRTRKFDDSVKPVNELILEWPTYSILII